MIEAILNGVGRALQILLFVAAVLAAWWGATQFRDRSRDMGLTIRNAAGIVVGGSLVLGLLIGTGHRLEAIFYFLTLFGLPVALGLAPKGLVWELLGQGGEGDQGSGAGGGGGVASDPFLSEGEERQRPVSLDELRRAQEADEVERPSRGAAWSPEDFRPQPSGGAGDGGRGERPPL